MRSTWLFAIAAGLAATPALADTLTIGTPATGNCIPFGCANFDAITEYQQFYARSSFAQPSSISAISFDRTSAGTINATYTVNFYLGAFNGLTTNLAANKGAYLGGFGTFTLTDAPARLTFAGPAFVYDPAAGNLVVDFTISNSSSSGTFYSSAAAGSGMQRAFNEGTVYQAGNGGLVTTFALTPLPETSSWVAMIVGVGAIGAATRRRRLAGGGGRVMTRPA